MKKLALLFLTILIQIPLLITVSVNKVEANSDRTTITPVVDTYISSVSPNQSFGNSQYLIVDGDSLDPKNSTYIKFDLGWLYGPALSYARLRLKVASTSSTHSNPQSNSTQMLHEYSFNNWDESMTFNTQPGKFGDEISLVNNNGVAGVWMEFDVTEEVKKYSGGYVSFFIRSIFEGDDIVFYSSEAEEANRPQLLLLHAPSIPTPSNPNPVPPPPPPTPTSSTIKVYAGGTSAAGILPSFDLYIKNVKVKSFSNVSGDPYNRNFQEFSYSQTEKIDPAEIKIEFTNDFASGGEDRNLAIDRINIDGIDYQTEASTTYSTGTWEPSTNCAAGNKSSEWLHCGGYFQFDNTSPNPPIPPTNTNANLFKNAKYYVDTQSQAYIKYQESVAANDSNAQEIEKIAKTPQAKWFGGWNTDIQEDVNSYVSRADAAGSLPVLVAYNIPMRDCGGHSSGGSTSPQEYKSWISEFTQGIGDKRAVVVFEPDGLGLIDCWPVEGQQSRLELYRFAMDLFAAKPNISVYIETSFWLDPVKAAELLSNAGVNKARGIVVNVSNYQTSTTSINYIKNVRNALGKEIFGLIDTSRNGSGPTSDNMWCNAPGRALGQPATANTNDSIIDAFFWIKSPGESDGLCNGGPQAGHWWQEYAVELAKNSPFFTSNPTPQPQPPAPNPNGSKLNIYAAGTPADGIYPTIDVLVKGVKVQSFSSIKGETDSRQFQEYTYTHSSELKPGDIRINFVNDGSNATEDRNILIDKITIDGVSYQTESETTYSVGSWNGVTGCAGGYKKSEWIHCEGYFQFGEDTTPTPTPVPPPTTSDSILKIYAAGTPADGIYPTLEIFIKGMKVKTITGVNGNPNNRIFNEYIHSSTTKINIDDVKIGFSNDGANSTEDRNVLIDKINIDGVDYQTEVTTTYSTGTWEASTGCSAGYKKSEWLHCGGHFQFGKTESTTPPPAPSPVPPPVTTPPSEINGFKAEYFNNITLSGTPTLNRDEQDLNYDWGGGSPHSSIQNDNFSARWSKIQNFTSGTYTFSVSTDDGIRIYIDERLIFDKWYDQNSTFTFSHDLSGGEHLIKIEYYEKSGGARMSFKIN